MLLVLMPHIHVLRESWDTYSHPHTTPNACYLKRSILQLWVLLQIVISNCTLSQSLNTIFLNNRLSSIDTTINFWKQMTVNRICVYFLCLHFNTYYMYERIMQVYHLLRPIGIVSYKIVHFHYISNYRA